MCKPNSKVVGLGYYLFVATLMGFLTMVHPELDSFIEMIFGREVDVHGVLLTLNVVLLIYIPLTILFFFVICNMLVDDPTKGDPPFLMAMHPFDFWMMTHMQHQKQKRKHRH